MAKKNAPPKKPAAPVKKPAPKKKMTLRQERALEQEKYQNMFIRDRAGSDRDRKPRPPEERTPRNRRWDPSPEQLAYLNTKALPFRAAKRENGMDITDEEYSKITEDINLLGRGRARPVIVRNVYQWLQNHRTTKKPRNAGKTRQFQLQGETPAAPACAGSSQPLISIPSAQEIVPTQAQLQVQYNMAQEQYQQQGQYNLAQSQQGVPPFQYSMVQEQEPPFQYNMAQEQEPPFQYNMAREQEPPFQYTMAQEQPFPFNMVQEQPQQHGYMAQEDVPFQYYMQEQHQQYSMQKVDVFKWEAAVQYEADEADVFGLEAPQEAMQLRDYQFTAPRQARDAQPRQAVQPQEAVRQVFGYTFEEADLMENGLTPDGLTSDDQLRILLEELDSSPVGSNVEPTFDDQLVYPVINFEGPNP